LPSYGKHKDNYSYTAVGASGAVSAVLFASIVFFPLGKITIFPIPIGIPAILFGPLFLVYSAYMSKKNIDNVGHDVHFWGAVFGFVFTIVLKPALLTNLYLTLLAAF
jgi:membrane associated rhomboid family serine protease